jgi:DNA polymerase elongation subunit (family B)
VKPKSDNLKILYFDIETTPLVAYSWGPKWKTNLLDFVEPVRILSFSAKWDGGKHITKGWPHYKGYKPNKLDDKAIVKAIWDLFDEADIIIAHNGIDFDIRIVNARFTYHGLTPPSQYKVLDTKNEAKKYLRLASYTLDDICGYFGFGKKLPHEGFSLWLRCMAGDKAAWKTMLEYNSHDVGLLEQVYKKVRPFIKQHPHILPDKPQCCPRCGSDKLQWRGVYRNLTTSYRRFVCTNCGGWGRDHKNVQKPKPLVGT